MSRISGPQVSSMVKKRMLMNDLEWALDRINAIIKSLSTLIDACEDMEEKIHQIEVKLGMVETANAKPQEPPTASPEAK